MRTSRLEQTAINWILCSFSSLPFKMEIPYSSPSEIGTSREKSAPGKDECDQLMSGAKRENKNDCLFMEL